MASTLFANTTETIAPADRTLKLPPFADRALAYFEFTFANGAVARKNLRNPYAPAIEIGTPTYGAGGIQVNNVNGLSLYDDTGVFTRLHLARAIGADINTPTTIPVIGGNFAAGSGGCMLWFYPSGGAIQLGSFRIGTDPAVANPSHAVYNVVGHRVTADGTTTVKNFTSGASRTLAGIGAYVPPNPARRVRLGGVHTPGVSQHASALAYGAALTDAEWETAAAWVAAQAPYLGISIGA